MFFKKRTVIFGAAILACKRIWWYSTYTASTFSQACVETRRCAAAPNTLSKALTCHRANVGYLLGKTALLFGGKVWALDAARASWWDVASKCYIHAVAKYNILGWGGVRIGEHLEGSDDYGSHWFRARAEASSFWGVTAVAKVCPWLGLWQGLGFQQVGFLLSTSAFEIHGDPEIQAKGDGLCAKLPEDSKNIHQKKLSNAPSFCPFTWTTNNSVQATQPLNKWFDMILLKHLEAYEMLRV